MKNLIAIFANEEGATAAEYAILAAFIAAVIAGAAALLGTDVRDAFTKTETTIQNHLGG